jgi:uncharacterized zinc-type alcohol dehydrogenase-like protein
MNGTNDNNQLEEPGTISHSRREFMGSAATAVADVGAASLLNLQTANAANTINAVAIGDGSYPVEGMAAYSPTGPHKLMKFQRRALGPKDVAIKINYCGVCHSDIHTIRGDWVRSNIPKLLVMSSLARWSLLDQVSANSMSDLALALARW